MATPLLQALPSVLTSGFLHQHGCITSSSTCKNWYCIWKEVEDQFPEDSKVELRVENIWSRGRGTPDFVCRNGLLEALHTPAFARQIWDKVNELKEAAKKGNAAKKKFRRELPVWGVGVRRVNVSFWGPTTHNDGGVCITYYKHSFTGHSIAMVRLDPDLILWTGIRNWKVYDGQPLWP